jgi:hypothetical protein
MLIQSAYKTVLCMQALKARAAHAQERADASLVEYAAEHSNVKAA